ncbi:hypothetical protein I4U23_027451 [Adineta vaga]|nr:hypothetical protein I4U23_027451 [Adineta vaga]
MGSVFRIGKLTRSSEGIWIVPLALTDDHDKRLTALKEHFKKSMGDSNVCLSFAFETETTPQRRSVLYVNLAMVKDELDQNEAALDYYNKSLELEETGGKAVTYNNMATLFCKMKETNKAIQYYQKAIEECNAQNNSNRELIATLHTNIAGILNGQGKHEEALGKCQEALKINLEIFPEIHPTIANTYNMIANTMYYLSLYTKAVEYAEEALKIDKKALRKGHPQTLSHQNNLEIYKQAQKQAEMNNNQ